MKAEEIIEGNKLIAGFMNTGKGAAIWVGDGFGGKISYNNSWNWLMPVVEKIFHQPFEDGEYPSFRTFGMLDNDTGGYMVRIDRHRVFSSEKLIESTWLAVVDFIETLSQAKN